MQMTKREHSDATSSASHMQFMGGYIAVGMVLIWIGSFWRTSSMSLVEIVAGGILFGAGACAYFIGKNRLKDLDRVEVDPNSEY